MCPGYSTSMALLYTCLRSLESSRTTRQLLEGTAARSFWLRATDAVRAVWPPPAWIVIRSGPQRSKRRKVTANTASITKFAVVRATIRAIERATTRR
jgi:hypothetical protein